MGKFYTSELNTELLSILLERCAVRDPQAKKDGYFQSASGKPCYILAPEKSDINIHDIAVSLARISRWGGRTKTHKGFGQSDSLIYSVGPLHAMSVAQHSVIVSYLADDELAGLMHDSPEAYLGDVISPLKRILRPLYAPLEVAWGRRIGEIFGLGDKVAFMPTDVQCADLLALEVERWDLMPQDGPAIWGHDSRPTTLPTIEPLDEYEAYALFMARFKELTAK
jgi:hypothetical protein